jgi:hypothetical protein
VALPNPGAFVTDVKQPAVVVPDHNNKYEVKIYSGRIIFINPFCQSIIVEYN